MYPRKEKLIQLMQLLMKATEGEITENSAIMAIQFDRCLRGERARLKAQVVTVK